MEQHTKAPLWHFTTLKVGGIADYLCLPQNTNELIELLDRLKKEDQPWHILGGGSNILISSQGVPGTVIRLTQLTETISPEPGIIEAKAGVRLPHLSRYAASLDLAGLEFMVGIPGTVGGGVIMNAGAHGGCLADVIESVTIFDTKKWDIVTLPKEKLEFTYRKSALNPEQHIVLSARLRLVPDSKEAIADRMRHNEDYRWKTQPISWPSAGSTFKNPKPDCGAGYLLDKAGVKQLQYGQAAVSAVHANFVINLGGATSTEVTSLLKHMQESVHKAFDVHLSLEWKRLGKFSASEIEVWQ